MTYRKPTVPAFGELIMFVKRSGSAPTVLRPTGMTRFDRPGIFAQPLASALLPFSRDIVQSSRHFSRARGQNQDAVQPFLNSAVDDTRGTGRPDLQAGRGHRSTTLLEMQMKIISTPLFGSPLTLCLPGPLTACVGVFSGSSTSGDGPGLNRATSQNRHV
jgi:hypothetical protein